MSVTVTVVPPPKVEYKVRIEADLTLREAAILQVLLGRTTGDALQDLYNALSGNKDVEREALKLPDRYGHEHVEIDISALEKA